MILGIVSRDCPGCVLYALTTYWGIFDVNVLNFKTELSEVICV